MQFTAVRLLVLGLALALPANALMAQPAVGQPGAARTELDEPIRIFLAKKIVTMDPSWPTATAVAVRKGKILSVGSPQEIKLWVSNGEEFEVVRAFEDKILLPGFIEPHGHPLLGATALASPLLTRLPVPDPYGRAFSGLRSKEDAIEALRGYVDQGGSGDSLLAWGYDYLSMGGHLFKEDLDEASKDRAIVVWDLSQQWVYLNSAALKKHKITKQNARQLGAMATTDGTPSGPVFGVAAQPILAKELTPLLAPEVAWRNMRRLAELSRQGGITTTSELAFGAMNVEAEEKIYDGFFNHPQSALRCVCVVHGPSLTARLQKNAVNYVSQLRSRNSDKLMFHGVKFFADESLAGLSMMMEDPGYIDGHKGVWRASPSELLEQMRPWWQAGFHLHVHANGNAANRSAIEALDSLQRARARFDHRYTLEHFSVATPDLIRRAKELGAVASVNPYHLYYRGEALAAAIGSDRASTIARLRSLAEAGVPTALHSDTPFGPPRPLEWAWIAVNRLGIGGATLAPAERISVPQAMRMITIDAAYVIGVEDQVGSIQAGKHADFVVLEDDPFEIERGKLNNVRVWGVVLGGKIVPAGGANP